MTRALDVTREALAAWTGLREGARTADAALALLESAEAHVSPLETRDETERRLWHEYLAATGTPDFLQQLPDDEARRRWADAAVLAVRRSGYSLETMLAQRVAAHPDRVLFSDRRDTTAPARTYAQVAWYARSIAGALLEAHGVPRVAILAENSIDSACADLACLLHGLLVTPLNLHFEQDTLAWIFERLQINIVVTDSDDRLRLLEGVRATLGRDFTVGRRPPRPRALQHLRRCGHPLRGA